VHTYHGHIFHSYYGSLKTRLFIAIEKALARLVTESIVVVSEQQRREIHETFGVGRANQFVVIPLGLDLNAFANWRDRRRVFREELGAGSDDVLVGIVGRLTEIKNHELFLRSVARFKESWRGEMGQPRVRFVVIGDGSLRGRLESQAHSLGLGEDVIFTGSRRDPENFYAALDIVALTSLNEGTPLTLIEAMASARAVIATTVGGVVDLLGDALTPEPESEDGRYSICQRGIGIRANDTEAFAAGLNRLVKDAELRRALGDRGSVFVSGNYSRERLLKDMRTLYDQLLERHPVSVKARPSDRSLESRV
jgi:glycosyltransferase involved in cell wall biosynthesis